MVHQKVYHPKPDSIELPLPTIEINNVVSLESQIKNIKKLLTQTKNDMTHTKPIEIVPVTYAETEKLNDVVRHNMRREVDLHTENLHTLPISNVISTQNYTYNNNNNNVPRLIQKIPREYNSMRLSIPASTSYTKKHILNHNNNCKKDRININLAPFE